MITCIQLGHRFLGMRSKRESDSSVSYETHPPNLKTNKIFCHAKISLKNFLDELKNRIGMISRPSLHTSQHSFLHPVDVPDEQTFSSFLRWSK
ncbi:hypothetical protein KOR42_33270 [Thalassoglobus neptunius]|uniref:Uncharacterized protein n=1 Tax=Thalassoglobus neptunius TaxID=1938619 RepID=A0A5C5WPC2_9PLAN|nr:hypothetical protein KOR42_33270 [Thalassoglobus neptunius]